MAFIYISSSQNGSDWNDPTGVGLSTDGSPVNADTAPDLVYFNQTYFIFYKGYSTDDQIYLVWSDTPAEAATWSQPFEVPGATTTAAPNAMIVGKSVFLFYKSSSDDSIYMVSSEDPAKKWTTPKVVSSALNTSGGLTTIPETPAKNFWMAYVGTE